MLTKAPLLLEEMVKIAAIPRVAPAYGWMVRALSQGGERTSCVLFSSGRREDSRDKGTCPLQGGGG